MSLSRDSSHPLGYYGILGSAWQESCSVFVGLCIRTCPWACATRLWRWIGLGTILAVWTQARDQLLQPLDERSEVPSGE